MKHWIRFLQNGGSWARHTAFDMEIMYHQQERVQAELAYISRQIEEAEQILKEEVFTEWSLADIQQAIEAAQKENTKTIE